jgi:hypothetical protein
MHFLLLEPILYFEVFRSTFCVLCKGFLLWLFDVIGLAYFLLELLTLALDFDLFIVVVLG